VTWKIGTRRRSRSPTSAETTGFWKKLPAFGINCRVGQLAAANGDDGIGDLPRIRPGELSTVEFGRQIGIAGQRLPVLSAGER
jgi:hypothetical protein